MAVLSKGPQQWDDPADARTGRDGFYPKPLHGHGDKISAAWAPEGCTILHLPRGLPAPALPSCLARLLATRAGRYRRC